MEQSPKRSGLRSFDEFTKTYDVDMEIIQGHLSDIKKILKVMVKK